MRWPVPRIARTTTRTVGSAFTAPPEKSTMERAVCTSTSSSPAVARPAAVTTSIMMTMKKTACVLPSSAT